MDLVRVLAGLLALEVIAEIALGHPAVSILTVVLSTHAVYVVFSDSGLVLTEHRLFFFLSVGEDKTKELVVRFGVVLDLVNVAPSPFHVVRQVFIDFFVVLVPHVLPEGKHLFFDVDLSRLLLDSRDMFDDW